MANSGITVPDYSVMTDKPVVDAFAAVKSAIEAAMSEVIEADGEDLAVTPAIHRNKVIALNRAGGVDVQLPAATGSGDRYTFVVVTSASGGGAYAINTDLDAGDEFIGHAVLLADGGDTVVAFAGGGNQILMDGSTQGGLAGASVKLIDIAEGKWFAEVVSDASGTEATPFETRA